MNPLATTFLLVALLASLLDWIAVARQTATLEYVAKPAATVLILATAASLDVSHDASWVWRVGALAFCLLGDVFLMLPRDSFVKGLSSFAVAQTMFVISFATGDTSAGRAIIGLIVAVPFALILSRRFVTAMKCSGHGELVIPVVVYLALISAMAVSSIAEGSGLAIAGALSFMVSDALIAESRFVKERAWQPVGIMVTYHLALAGLVLGLL